MYKNGSGSDDNPARNKMPDVVPIRSAGGGSDLASLSPSGPGTSQAIIMYTNGSDSNPIMLIRATSRAQKNNNVRSRSESVVGNQIRQIGTCPIPATR